ncbi:hypothetical protein GCM10025776_17320 [Corallincola platygyrae]
MASGELLVFKEPTQIEANRPAHLWKQVPMASRSETPDPAVKAEATKNTPGLGTSAPTVQGGKQAAPILETLDLLAVLPNGKPAIGLPYTATLSTGEVLSGTLDGNGKAHHDNLKPATAHVEFGEQPDESAIFATRSKISAALAGILVDERAEFEARKATYDELNLAEKAAVSTGALLTGLWNAGKDTAEFAYNVYDLVHPQQQLKRAVGAAWQAYNLESDDWSTTFVSKWQDSEHQALVKALGFDPSQITKEMMAEAYEVASFVYDDAETQAQLVKFGKDYVSLQHHTELTEIGGGAVFEIVLAALLAVATGGAAAVALGASKLAKLKKLGALFQQLAKQLKKKAKFKKQSGATNGKIEAKLDKPEGADIAEGQTKRFIRTAAEDRAEISRLSKEASLAEKSGNAVLARQRIEEARDILRPYLPRSPEQSWDEVIERLDVTSPKDGAVFWSGSPDKAKEFAQNIDGVTLETTLGGKIIDQWDTGHVWSEGEGPPPWSKDLWSQVSEKYADGISGKVNLIQTDNKLWDPGTIWHNKEKALVKDKILMGEVDSLSIHVVKSDGTYAELPQTYVNTLMEYTPVN